MVGINIDRRRDGNRADQDAIGLEQGREVGEEGRWVGHMFYGFEAHDILESGFIGELHGIGGEEVDAGPAVGSASVFDSISGDIDADYGLEGGGSRKQPGTIADTACDVENSAVLHVLKREFIPRKMQFERRPPRCAFAFEQRRNDSFQTCRVQCHLQYSQTTR